MNWIKTTILMAAITALFMSVGHLLGARCSIQLSKESDRPADVRLT